MAITRVNSSFKIKAGGVPTTLGTVPEPGAIVFHRNLAQMFYGDGFNWIPLQQEIDSLALELLPAQLYQLTADTPAPMSVFDKVIYNTGDSYTTDEPGQSITVLNNGDYQFNVSFEIAGDVNAVRAHTAMLINGVPEDGYDAYLADRDTFYVHTLSYPKTLAANDVLTFQIECDGNDDITVRNFTMGIQNIV